MTTITPQLIDEVGDLLKSSVTEVFSTMFELSADPVELVDIRGGGDTFIAGSVGFVGDLNGIVYVYFKATFARTLTARMLGMPEAEVEGDEMIGDVIGELTNMVVGATKSRLCDSGSACKLTIPSIVRGQNLRVECVRPTECLLLTIACGDELILVELILKPSD